MSGTGTVVVLLLMVITACQVTRLVMAWRSELRTAGMLRQYVAAMERVFSVLTPPPSGGEDPTQIPIGLGLGKDGAAGVLVSDEEVYQAGCQCLKCRDRRMTTGERAN